MTTEQMNIEDAVAALDGYAAEAQSALEAVETVDDAELWYRAHLAPSGQANAWRRKIGSVPGPERKNFGGQVNTVVKGLEAEYETRRADVEAKALEARLKTEKVDVTLPARQQTRGALHPIRSTLREVCSIFGEMGFSIFETPHTELSVYNFDKLNMPPEHPARDMQDTLYVSDDVVLRTHTSAGQIRAMEKLGPGPIRVVLPGLCYRAENITTRSEMQFHQVEGLLVGEDVQMSDLKGVLLQFARRAFGEDQKLRLRGSYFPFTEPSVEVDILCTICLGDGCGLCKKTGWLELLGAGLVHPTVLENGGYDPSRYRGIAFGMGIERMVLLRHQIDDIRYFYGNDLRFLSEFY